MNDRRGLLRRMKHSWDREFLFFYCHRFPFLFLVQRWMSRALIEFFIRWINRVLMASWKSSSTKSWKNKQRRNYVGEVSPFHFCIFPLSSCKAPSLILLFELITVNSNGAIPTLPLHSLCFVQHNKAEAGGSGRIKSFEAKQKWRKATRKRKYDNEKREIRNFKLYCIK